MITEKFLKEIDCDRSLCDSCATKVRSHCDFYNAKGADMTIDEAIKHAEEVADYDCYGEKQIKCAEEHRQLAEWLKELKRLREQTKWIPQTDRKLKNLSERVENIEKMIREDQEWQLKKLKAQVEYDKFRLRMADDEGGV